MPASLLRRPTLRRVLAALLGVVVALGLGEVLARLLSPRYAERISTYEIAQVARDPSSWVYVPGSTVTFSWDGDPLGTLPPGARIEDTVNRLGLRGPLPDPTRRPVVMLGDSFTFGEGVTLEDTFVERLATELRPRGLTFVNAGVSGHSTIEEAARLDGLLDALNPISVVLVFVPNDAIPWNETAQQRTDLLTVEERTGSRLLELAASLGTSDHVEEWYHSFYRGAKSADWDRARRALLAMAERCRARQVRFAVVHFPLLHRLDDYPFKDIEECVADAAREARVPYLDLTTSFAGQDARAFWVHPVDRHPNAKAHAIAAEALRPFVEELVK